MQGNLGCGTTGVALDLDLGVHFAEIASGCTITESRPLSGLFWAAKPRL